VDPAQLEDENPLPSKLFLLYHFLIGSMAGEDFSGAEDWLKWALRVHAPPDTRFILDRFNQLLDVEIGELNLTRFFLDEGRGHVRWLREEEAGASLAQALGHLATANMTLGELEGSAVQLASILRTSPEPVLVDLDSLLALMERYMAMIGELKGEAALIELQKGGKITMEELEELLKGDPELTEERVREMEEEYARRPLTGTRLVIGANTTQALVGSKVSLWGRLTTLDGTPLTARDVDLFFDGELDGEALTGSDGDFETIFRVPYVYNPSMTVSAEYWPEDDDVGVYTPAASNTVVLSLIYYTSRLEVEGPSWAYPGTDAAFNGSLSLDGEPLEGLNVGASAFDERAVALSGSEGGFSLTLSVPPEAPEGPAPVEFVTVPREVYGPAEARLEVYVVRLLSQLELDAPRWIMSGTVLRVAGSVTVDKRPLKACLITVEYGEKTVMMRTFQDGSFQARLDLPLTMFTDRYSYRVTATPIEAWIEPDTASGGVFIVNLVTLLGAPVFLGVALVYAARNIEPRPRRKKKETRAGDESREAPREPEAPARDASETFPEIYGMAVTLVAGFTDRPQLQNHTIREYLKAVEDTLDKSVHRLFRKLSMRYEAWLYGIPLEPDLGEALKLLSELEEKLVEG